MEYRNKTYKKRNICNYTLLRNITWLSTLALVIVRTVCND